MYNVFTCSKYSFQEKSSNDNVKVPTIIYNKKCTGQHKGYSCYLKFFPTLKAIIFIVMKYNCESFIAIFILFMAYIPRFYIDVDADNGVN